MKGFIVSVILVLALVQGMVEQGQAITCGQVNGFLAPCIPYLTKGTGDPTDACCGGVKSLVAAVGNVADKRAACGCVKEAASRLSDLKDSAAQALPAKCGVKLDIPISKTVNCDM